MEKFLGKIKSPTSSVVIIDPSGIKFLDPVDTLTLTADNPSREYTRYKKPYALAVKLPKDTYYIYCEYDEQGKVNKLTITLDPQDTPSTIL